MAEYLIRHGESGANVRGVFAGQRDDSELTELGEQQARAAVEKLIPLEIVRIICSPLKRARKTAEIVAAGLGNIQVQVDERLAEYDMGDISGTPIRYVDLEELRHAPGAEDARAFARRVFASLLEHASDQGNTLFVGHGGTAKIMAAVLEDREPLEFFNLHLHGNAEVTPIDTGAIREKVADI